MDELPDDVVLAVDNLSIDFHLRTHILHAVQKVGFRLKRGRTFCLVGESGSGKSVTARSLMQIVDKPGRIVEGRILLRNAGAAPTDIATLDPDGRAVRDIRGRRIGLIFQEPMSSLSPVHTIGSQIVEAIRLHSDLDKPAARARAIELLRQVEIPTPERMVDRYTFEFSGGMRQRAMIAMALAGNPEILIADEPTTALDVTTQAEILDLIKRLQVERGMAMLLITHDMGIVAEVADAVAVMRYGRIVEHGPVDAIYHAAQHPYTRQLLASTVKLTRNVAGKLRPAVAAAPSGPLLSVRNLGKVFGRPDSANALHAVADANFDLFPGENLGIVGESGSGKTTLGRLILRTLEPTSGTVTFRGRGGATVDVTRLGKAELRGFHREVRLVFQDPFSSLNPRMTVKEVIADPLIVNGHARGKTLDDRVAEMMKLVGLDPQTMERYPHAFSGGQRQRICIARALALDPSIIIADEATAALDVSIRSQILDLLLELRQRLDLSFLFISHDISVVRYFCDRVAVMHRGRIVELGTAEQICTEPREAYTRSLISAVPNPDPRDKRMMHRHRFAAPVGV
jgi:peptide/nickel transport system ATP-binding protein